MARALEVIESPLLLRCEQPRNLREEFNRNSLRTCASERDQNIKMRRVPSGAAFLKWVEPAQLFNFILGFTAGLAAWSLTPVFPLLVCGSRLSEFFLGIFPSNHGTKSSSVRAINRPKKTNQEAG